MEGFTEMVICYRCGDEFGGPVGKPRFLEQLESYLKKELQALDLQQPKVQERKLQVPSICHIIYRLSM